MPKWRDFERLAEKIMTDLQPQAEVTWNDHIYGYDTETPRQIDVSIRWSDGDHSYLTIVQTKDWRQPADINTVGEFISVVRDVRATGGILVCSAGFSERAIVYARNPGVRLYDLHDATSHHWSRDLTIPLIWISLEPKIAINWQVHLDAGDQVARHPKTKMPPVSVDGGKTIVDLMQTFENQWNQGNLNRESDALHRIEFPDAEPRQYVTTANGTGLWRPIQNLHLSYVVPRRAWLGQFRPDDCRGLIDYLDDQAFKASYLALEQVPAVRDDSWIPIANPDETALQIRGTVVTSESYEVVVGGSEFEEFTIRRSTPPD